MSAQAEAETGRRYHTVARVGDVLEGEGKACRIEGHAIALFLAEGQYRAIEDVCPHKGLPLHDGIVSGCVVTCLAHDWPFDLKDGHCLDNPRFRVWTFPVRVVNDKIQVAVD